ncbi:MAG: hypothetical protein HYZ47_03535 [Simkania negevensis]|nr:hypothetical protein [Simkania negevensis]
MSQSLRQISGVKWLDPQEQQPFHTQEVSTKDAQPIKIGQLAEEQSSPRLTKSERDRSLYHDSIVQKVAFRTKNPAKRARSYPSQSKQEDSPKLVRNDKSSHHYNSMQGAAIRARKLEKEVRSYTSSLKQEEGLKITEKAQPSFHQNVPSGVRVRKKQTKEENQDKE